MRRRIVLLVAATTSVVLLAFTLPLVALVRDVARSSALENATTIAQSLVPVVSTGDSEAIGLALGSLTAPEGTTVSVYLGSSTVIGAPVPPDADVAGVVEASSSRTVTTADGGRAILIPVFGPEGARVIRVDVSPDALSEGVARAALVIGGLALALFLLSLLVADRLARTLTRPLTDLAATADALADGDLAARARPEGPPEVRDVGIAMNALAGRIVELLQAERETIADLSHRLRTPLTALRLDAEALPDGDQRRRLEDGVDAMQRSVDEVIRTARRPLHEGLSAACDANAVVAARVAFWGVLAEDQGRPMRVEVDDRHRRIGLAADDLSAALDALLGNVFAHTPDGTAFAVVVEDARMPDGRPAVRIVVADEGPGLAVDPGRGTSGSGSTGLGLDIARRTCLAAGGGFDLSSGSTGTRAVLDLPVLADER